MAEVQNSNPTILNVADLPTRSRSTKKSGDYDYTSGIFAAVPNPADFLSSDSEDDDLLEEPIDEQEIFGKCPQLVCMRMRIYMYPVQSSPNPIPSRSNKINLRPGTPPLPRRTSRSLPPRHINQTNPPKRPQLSPPNSHRPDHTHNHTLQSSNGHRPRCPRSTGTISSPALPDGCAH